MQDEQQVSLSDDYFNSQQLYEKMVWGIDEYAIFSMDTNGVLSSWNPGVEKVLGYREWEFVGQDVGLIFTAEDRGRGEPQKERKEAAANGKAMDDRWHLRRDGSRLWVNGVATALRNTEGQLTGYVKVMRDNTKEKQADDALQRAKNNLEQRVKERTKELQEALQEVRKSEAQLRQVFNAGPFAAVLTTAAEDRFVRVNEAFCRLSGYSAEEVIGKWARDLGMWSSKDDVSKLRQAQQDGKQFRELELTLRTKDGDLRTILSSSVEIGDGAGIRTEKEHGAEDDALLLKMFYDVTEHRRTEEELMKAIQAVMQDTAWFSRSVIERLATIKSGGAASDPSELEELTRREQQVLARLAKGEGNAEIAAALSIAEQTVRNYVASIYSKINVNSRAEAVVWARERGLGA